VSPKNMHILSISLLNIDFQNSFTGTLCRKFAIKPSEEITPCLKQKQVWYHVFWLMVYMLVHSMYIITWEYIFRFAV